MKARSYRLVAGLLAVGMSAPAMALSPALAEPIEDIASTFRAGMVREATRPHALERAYSDIQALFFQLRVQSTYQWSPRPTLTCGKYILAAQRYQAALHRGTFTRLDAEGWHGDGVRPALGVEPSQNSAALERFRVYAGLPSGRENVEVARRLQQLVKEIELAYFGDNFSEFPSFEAPYPQAWLGFLAYAQLQDFIMIEQRAAGI